MTSNVSSSPSNSNTDGSTASHPSTILRHKAYFAGEWHELAKTFAVTSPATGVTLGEVADCGPTEAEKAIEAAVIAQQAWRQVQPFRRGRILKKWNQLIMKHREALGELMTREMGKPITEAIGEAVYAASFVEWCGEQAEQIAGERLNSRLPQRQAMTQRVPVGVVYAVTPWNFPAGMITRKAGPALAAGCAIILKPAELSPMTALYLAELWEQAGGPANTLQVLPSSDPAALSAPILADERVRKLTFTGSTAVGRALYAEASKTLKRVSLELGGHAPFVIFEDANLEQAADDVIASKFRNTGQTCISTNRVYVQRAVAEAFTKILADKTAALKVGNPAEKDTQIGPLVEASALEKVKTQVQDACTRGAKVEAGGAALEGLFHQPTVLSNVHPDSLILREETFGPVAPVVPFDSEEEVLQLANNTPYGLAAYAYTNDLGRAWRISDALEYGIVGINDGTPTAGPNTPFGGLKNSGVGSEGGWWGLDEYLETKFISMGV